MNSKKWIKSFLIITSIIIGSIIILFVLVNPYRLLPYSLTDKNFYFTKYYSIKLFDMLKEKKHSIIFGTSRSQRLQTDNSNIPILNFSSSLYGNSLSVLNFLKQLDNKRLSNIHRIYYLVDDHCLNGSDQSDSFSKYYDIEFHASYWSYVLKDLSYVNKNKLMQLYNDIEWNINNSYDYYLQKNGSMVRSNPNESFHVPDKYTSKATPQYYQEDGIQALLDIDKFCKANNIHIDYYTPTHYQKYLKLMDIKIMKDKYSKLLNGGITGFHALWYIDDISNLVKDNKYIAFSDRTSHLNENYVHNVFIDYVAKNNQKYFIKNEVELKEYLEDNKNNFK
ncbi:hypothetical protein SMGD1_1960 [Sulfurimonas gotlandica GD1]|uniref:Uncharacterized protein n=1 Tax=Sulfurimonas gotlandica (strain DSM 19862 / JCM 16533 / GD1) TaxID=929558 RepID=B6BIX2_SULGG|nr:hypothetical protein [Sulfurimonas gotlandica]EDZ62895.1 hypothetical protein CBGD1_513 [Sulfurimonas gotlandica GD1]EHP30483.1 hypothetical protein SMGD1_1960 [Sulfurimonas gotlandica GD1]